MPSADTVIVAAPMPTPFTIPSETDEPLSPLAAVILIPAATADANNVLTLVRIKFEKYTSGAPHDIEITFGICSIPSTTTGTVVAYLNTLINSAREFGAIYKIIVKFDVGQHAPIISTSTFQHLLYFRLLHRLMRSANLLHHLQVQQLLAFYDTESQDQPNTIEHHRQLIHQMHQQNQISRHQMKLLRLF